ncbi:MAG: hypothetical protein AAF961_13665, partial [Planctomycetota bacterium]
MPRTNDVDASWRLQRIVRRQLLGGDESARALVRRIIAQSQHSDLVDAAIAGSAARIDDLLQRLDENDLPTIENAMRDLLRRLEVASARERIEQRDSLLLAAADIETDQRSVVAVLEAAIADLRDLSRIHRFFALLLAAKEDQRRLIDRSTTLAKTAWERGREKAMPEAAVARRTLSQDQNQLSVRLADALADMREFSATAAGGAPLETTRSAKIVQIADDSDLLALQRRAAEQLASGRFALALTDQRAALAAIDVMIEQFRSVGRRNLQAVATRMQEAESVLRRLLQDVEELANRQESLPTGADEPSPPSAPLAERQRELAKSAEQLSQSLAEAGAAESSRATGRAAQHLGEHDQPASTRQAMRDLEAAAAALAELRRSFEAEAERRRSRMLLAAIEKLSREQNSLVADVQQVDATRAAAAEPAPSQQTEIQRIARRQSDVADRTVALRDLADSQPVVEFLLTATAEQMASARRRLIALDTGGPAQEPMINAV